MRARYALAATFVAGLFVVPLGLHDPIRLCGWFCVACAAGGLVVSALLASGASVPTWLGRTVLGQTLMSAGALVFGVLTLAGSAVEPDAGAAAAAIGTAAFLAGLLVEHRARRAGRPRVRA